MKNRLDREVAVHDIWRAWISYRSFAVKTGVFCKYTSCETLTHLRIDCTVIISTMVNHVWLLVSWSFCSNT